MTPTIFKPILYKGYSIFYDGFYNAYLCSIDNSKHDKVITAMRWIDYLTK